MPASCRHAYDEDAGDFDVPLPHPFDDSSAPWD